MINSKYAGLSPRVSFPFRELCLYFGPAVATGFIMQLIFSISIMGIAIFAVLIPMFTLLIQRDAQPIVWFYCGLIIGIATYSDSPLALAAWGSTVAYGPWMLAALCLALAFWLSAVLRSLLPANLTVFALPSSWVIVSQIFENLISLPLTFSAFLALQYAPILKVASIVGGLGYDYLILLFSSLVSHFVVYRKGIDIIRCSLVLIVVVAYPGVLSLVNDTRSSDSLTTRIYALQPAFSFADKRASYWSLFERNRQEYVLDDLTKMALSMKPGLVIWPEGGNGLFNSKLRRRHLTISEMLEGSRSELLIAGKDIDEMNGITNVVQQFTNSGMVGQAAKSIPVPITERHLTAGQPTVLVSKFGKIGISICFEAVFSAHAQALVEKGADVLLVLSDDSSFGRSQMHDWHLAYSILRGIEQNRSVGFLSNYGNSAYTNPSGKAIYSSREGRVQEIGVWNLDKSDKLSAYHLGGRYLPYIVSIALAIVALFRIRGSSERTLHLFGIVRWEIHVIAFICAVVVGLIAMLTSIIVIAIEQNQTAVKIYEDYIQRKSGFGIVDGIAPGFIQRRENTCGLAALAFIMAQYGDYVFEEELAAKYHVDRDGVSFKLLKEIAQDYGYIASPIKNGDYQILPSYGDPPMIAHFEPAHFVVVQDKDDNFVYYFDPAVGRTIRVNKPEFMLRWTGYYMKFRFMPIGRYQ